MSLNSLCTLCIVTLSIILTENFGQAVQYSQGEPYLFTDGVKTDSTSKELYDDFRQELKQKYQENLNSPAKTSLDTPTTSNPLKPRQITDWPKNELKLGQVTAVSIHPDGNPVIFHRHDRIWNEE